MSAQSIPSCPRPLAGTALAMLLCTLVAWSPTAQAQTLPASLSTEHTEHTEHTLPSAAASSSWQPAASSQAPLAHHVHDHAAVPSAAQGHARELSEAGYHVLILGNEKHPETVGIRGYVRGPSTVISTIPSLFSSTIFKSSVKIHKLGLVSQTTQEESLLAEAAKAALGVADELRIYNTICRATIERQALKTPVVSGTQH